MFKNFIKAMSFTYVALVTSIFIALLCVFVPSEGVLHYLITLVSTIATLGSYILCLFINDKINLLFKLLGESNA